MLGHRRTGLLDGDNTVFSELACPHQSPGRSVTEYLVFGRNEREGGNTNRASLIGSGKTEVLECGRKKKSSSSPSKGSATYQSESAMQVHSYI